MQLDNESGEHHRGITCPRSKSDEATTDTVAVGGEKASA